MAKKKNRSGAKEPSGGTIRPEWRRLVSAGATVAAVLVTLLLGWGLQAESGDETRPVAELMPTEPAETPPFETSDEPGGTPPSAEPPAAEPRRSPASAGESLAGRAAADRERILAGGGSWTLQFLYSCEPDKVRELARGVGNDDALYILPYDGCYRVCWGAWSSRDAAVAARDVPAPLAALPDGPFPRPIAEAAR